MKIFFLKPGLFITAIIVGVILSFALSPSTVPPQVEQKPVVITPVPTPEPVYIKSTPAPTPVGIQTQSNWSEVNADMEEITAEMFQIVPMLLLAAAGMMALTFVITLFGRP